MLLDELRDNAVCAPSFLRKQVLDLRRFLGDMPSPELALNAAFEIRSSPSCGMQL